MFPKLFLFRCRDHLSLTWLGSLLRRNRLMDECVSQPKGKGLMATSEFHGTADVSIDFLNF